MGGESSLGPKPGFSTRAIHAGQEPDPDHRRGRWCRSTRPRPTPRRRSGKHKGFEYARTHNPTRFALEAQPRRARGRRARLLLRLGAGGHTTLMQTLSAGDHVVAGDNLYGGTYRLFEQVFRASGSSSPTSTRPTSARSRRAFRPDTQLRVRRDADQPDAAAHRPRRGRAQRAPRAASRLVVDNTFMTPVLPAPARARRRRGAALDDQVPERPQRHGRRRAGHAATTALAEQLRFLQNAAGAVPGPDGLLARAARHQDAGGAHGAPRGERRARSPRSSRRTRGSSAVFYPGLAEPPAARAGASARRAASAA